MNRKIIITLLAISAVLTSCGNTESNADMIVSESSSASVAATEAAVTTSDMVTTKITAASEVTAAKTTASETTTCNLFTWIGKYLLSLSADLV